MTTTRSVATLVSRTVLLFLFSFALFSFAANQPAVAQLKIGSFNTATAVPDLPHPTTTPCIVNLFEGFIFDNFNAQNFTYTPPAACPGPWAAVILDANFSISAGIQYDRTANIWIGPTNIYFGTTAEDAPGQARNWHVQRNLTDYSSLFTTAQTGTVDLGNLVNSTYTGVLHGTANLLLYPAEPKNPGGALAATQVIGFSAGPNGGTVGLGNSSSLLEQTLTLPTNIVTAYLDVFAQGQSNDEFWYTCVPNSLTTELDSCGSTAFRETEITIDGTPAGVAPIYPWIFTGGIDPLLWVPIPGVQTLNFQPYRVNLTPFASLLNDGNSHTIALSVFNANSYFSATASLLLYQDPRITQITGAVTGNTLAAPVATINPNLHTAANGNVSGTVTTRAGHNFAITGYVNLPEGPVTTTVAQDITFSNLQQFKIQPTFYEQNITQDTTVHSRVITDNLGGHYVAIVNRNWPITVDIGLVFNSDGSLVQTTSINQYLETDTESEHNGQATAFSLVENRVHTTDALDISSAGYITGNQDQRSSQRFFEANSEGYCYSRAITAVNNLLASIVDGIGCE